MPSGLHIFYRPYLKGNEAVTDVNLGMLRPMNSADLDRVLKWRNHPSIRTNMYTQHEITPVEHQAWWERVKDSPNFRPYIYERDGIPLGYVAFSEISSKNKTATWAFYSSPDARRGTGSLMEFLALDEAFGAIGLRKLSCEVLGRNARVVKMHERFGFQREGLFREHVLIDGAFDDVHRLALFANEWTAMRAKTLKLIEERFAR